MTADWAAIRAAYEGDAGVSVRQIAKAHGVGHSGILKRAAREHWQRPDTGGAAAPAGDEQGVVGNEYGAKVDQATVADERQDPVTVEAGDNGAATMETEPAEIRAAKHALEEATDEMNRCRVALADLEGRQMAARARLRDIPAEITEAWLAVMLAGGDEAAVGTLRAERAGLEATIAELPAVREVLSARMEDARRRSGGAQAAISRHECLVRFDRLVREYAKRGQPINGAEESELRQLGGFGHGYTVARLIGALAHHCSAVGLNRRGEPMEWPAPAVAGGR
ncbi:MAG: hypothetical protein AB1568_05605 [Thermodesulfobacteriota bacterium]